MTRIAHTYRIVKITALVAALLAITPLLAWSAPSEAAGNVNRITIDPPGEREFIRDSAKLIDQETKDKIVALCDKLLSEKATPIIVVTIDSMAKHGGAGMRIETFATLLFDQWQIGHAKLDDQVWNTGILLLVSKGDRKARIELGAGWKREKDQLCQQIMDELMIPEFKQGNFSAGIFAGVEGLDKMARELQIPTRPRPWWHYAAVIGFVGLAFFTVVSLVRRGSGGWAWLLWAALFGIVGYMLYQMIANSGRGGGGFSGGSFGGGFSGGGGASGSW
ncbi:MAG: TPM domain-containing protein [Planctomycetales bacterium]